MVKMRTIFLSTLLFSLLPLIMQAQRLVIGSSTVVTIGPGTTVSVGTAASSGTLTNTSNAGLIIQSTSSGTGSLICGGTPNATVQRYLTQNAWHPVTPSTTGITANTFYWDDAPKAWLIWHDESKSGDDAWTYNTNLSTPMPVGQGWMVWLDLNTKSDATASMAGNLRSEDLTLDLDYTDASHGFNFVGNPFPCAINFNAGTWGLSSVEGTIWIWQNSSNNYLYRTSVGGGTMLNGIIPISQGFFVRASGSSASLTIPADARTHSSQSFYKGADADCGYESYLTIKAVKDQLEDEIWISFGQNGSNGFENGWDASKMFGGAEAPQLYLVEEGRKQSIDHLLTLGETERIVTMFFDPGQQGDQTLAADLSHLAEANVFLEDLLTGTTTKLNDQPVYQFQASVGDNSDRFRVHFKSAQYGIDDGDFRLKDLLRIYAYQNTLYIGSSGEAAGQTGTVRIFDITGRLLLREALPAGELVHLPIDPYKGYLVIEVIKPSDNKIQKLYNEY